MNELWAAIKKAIETSGKSQYQISKETGVSKALLSRFVRGERGLGVETLCELADYLGLEVIIRPKQRRR